MIFKKLTKALRDHWIDITIVIVLVRNDLTVSPMLYAYIMTPLVIRVITIILH